MQPAGDTTHACERDGSGNARSGRREGTENPPPHRPTHDGCPARSARRAPVRFSWDSSSGRAQDTAPLEADARGDDRLRASVARQGDDPLRGRLAAQRREVLSRPSAQEGGNRRFGAPANPHRKREKLRPTCGPLPGSRGEAISRLRRLGSDPSPSSTHGSRSTRRERSAKRGPRARATRARDVRSKGSRLPHEPQREQP